MAPPSAPAWAYPQKHSVCVGRVFRIVEAESTMSGSSTVRPVSTGEILRADSQYRDAIPNCA
eukprot:335711-Rhodomonas_salina.1